MVTDQEPRYRLVDSNGNITGTVFERGGELVVQEGTSGDGNELVLQSDGTVRAKELIGGYVYAGAFDGSDPDARLDKALAAAGDQNVFLESAEYSDSRTIASRINIIGNKNGGSRLNGSRLSSGTSWTLDSRVGVYRVAVLGGTIDCNARATLSELELTSGSSIDVSSSQTIVSHVRGGGTTLTFESSSSDCTVDTSVGLSVTDNGSNNTVGDIA